MCCEEQGELPNSDIEPTLSQPQLYNSMKAIDRASMYSSPTCALHKSPWLGRCWSTAYSLQAIPYDLSVLHPLRARGTLFLLGKGTAYTPQNVPAQSGFLLLIWTKVLPGLVENLDNWHSFTQLCLPVAKKTRETLHMDITRWSTPKSDWLYSLQPEMEKLYTFSKNKTGSWLWLRSWTPYCQIQT